MHDRIRFIDVMKAIGIIAIVLGHTIVQEGNIIGNALSAFKVPIFFFTSALVMNVGESSKEFVKNRILKLLVPYYGTSLISILIYIVIGSKLTPSTPPSRVFGYV